MKSPRTSRTPKNMLFHIDEANETVVAGWVLPDNPSSIPIIQILAPGSEPFEFEANVLRTDLRDKGLHETGMAGFRVDARVFPNFTAQIDQIEIRDRDTNVLIFRRFQPTQHLEKKVFRFELQAMPDPRIESVIKNQFALYYNTIHCYPEDTFFGIINNQTAPSLYVSGRPSLQKYEQWFRERDFKIFTIVRSPYEELAERLIFAKFASSAQASSLVVADYLCGLEPLVELAKPIQFDQPETIKAAFAAVDEAPKRALTNPLVKALACLPDDNPRGGHVEIALSKLAHMDVVGHRSRFSDFTSILAEVLGRDVFEGNQLAKIRSVQSVAETLSQIKQVRALIALDLDVYAFVEEAVEDAIGPVSAV
jgi:hypothetical protein